MNTTTTAGLVIVGAGQAGGDLTGALRAGGYKGAITLIGDEPYAPYRRPPLSKAFLSGEATLESLYLKPSEAYVRLGIDCRYGIGVERIERDKNAIRLYDGTLVPYEYLVLATGGRPRRLSLPGANHANVHYIRSIEDILRLKPQLLPNKRLLIVGGGYVGLEAASIGIKQGLQVSLVESLDRVLARVTAPELSGFYERAHRRRGVEMITGTGVHAFEGDPEVNAVVLSDGRRLSVDLVIVGIGMIPNTELADTAQLQVHNGIVVDAFTRTEDPRIFAIGDCCNHENVFLQRRLRLESVPNATEQARVCAASIGGNPVPYAAVPWFWSDQYDLKLQMVGLSAGYDELIIRGDMEKESFCALYLRDGILISADAVNRPSDFMSAKRMVAERMPVSATQLRDESINLKSLATSSRPTESVAKG
jgi:3-phenylpropionate/trans-cinnamate dioxygenase ferredoxin reductase subunit